MLIKRLSDFNRKMFSIGFLLLFSAIPSASSEFLDYKSCFSCNPDNYQLSELRIDQELDKINMHWIDAIVFIIGGVLALFLSATVIFSFIKYKKMREPPGDLFFAISISEFFLTCHWMISSGYFMTYPNDPPKTDSNFCQGNAYFSLGAGTLEFSYNCCFCLFLVFKIRNILKGKTFPNWVFHILCFVILTLVVLISKLTDNLGKSIFGTCSVIGISKLPIFGPLLLVVYLLMAALCIFYFKKKCARRQQILPKKAGLPKLLLQIRSSMLLRLGDSSNFRNHIYFELLVYSIR